ncbi:MAG: hypothetical protein IJ048_00015 [Clostridia bacterium]|nr:hypothetical protein [Clostridia bacterium]
MIELYQEAGYDFLALTDHWKRTIEAPRFYKNMLLLPGIELDYTLTNEVIHVVGINVDETILTRAERRHTARRGIRDIRRSGGRAILAHPAWSLNTLETMQELDGLTAAEIYNSVSAMPWNGDRADSMLLLDIAAAHGLLLNTVASDDSHFYTGEDRTSFTMLQADELTAEGINRALDAGTFYASRGPRFRQIEFESGEIHVECDPVSMITFHSDLPYVRERCVQGKDLTEATYKVNPERMERFVRVFLVDEQGRRAWANPIDVSSR